MKKLNFRGRSLKKMSRKKKKLLMVCILVVIALGASFIHARKAAEPEEEKVTETTEVAQRMDISKKISSKGEITSSLEEKRTPHATYILEKVNVSKGQAVKEGGTILTYTNGQVMTVPYDCVVEDWSLPDPKKKLTNSHYVTIAGTKVMLIELTVSENKIAMVRKGTPAVIKVKATGSKIPGEVSFVSDIGEYSDGSSDFKVQVTFDNDGKLKLGMNGRATIILQKAENAICVPVNAVYDDGEQSYVTKKTSKGTRDIEVETGIDDGDYIEIKSGLKEGDKVVVTTVDESEEDQDIMNGF